jgi:hypothetical protein
VLLPGEAAPAVLSGVAAPAGFMTLLLGAGIAAPAVTAAGDGARDGPAAW